MAIHPKPIERHIHDDRAFTRLCEGAPAGDVDISFEDLFALREARRDATLCPDCQDRVDPRDVHGCPCQFYHRGVGVRMDEARISDDEDR